MHSGRAWVTGRLDFRVLGPLEVVGETGAVALAQGKARTTLGVLLIHANNVVATDRLIDDVWGARPPATATKSVHVYVSQLRRSLGADAIVTRPPGYELRLEPGQLDLDRFERLREEAAHAEPATAAATCAKHSRCGAGRRLRTSPTPPLRRRRSLASRSCVSVRSKNASRPSWSWDATRRSWVNSPRSPRSIRCASGSAPRRCSRSTAPVGKQKRSPPTRARVADSSTSSASSPAGPCTNSSGAS